MLSQLYLASAVLKRYATAKVATKPITAASGALGRTGCAVSNFEQAMDDPAAELPEDYASWPVAHRDDLRLAVIIWRRLISWITPWRILQIAERRTFTHWARSVSDAEHNPVGFTGRSAA